MPASETISSHVSATSAFEVCPLRFRFAALKLRDVNSNTLRGAFGAALRRLDLPAYEQYFAPRKIKGTPSGLSDPPRPFVFRMRGPLDIGLNLFLFAGPTIDLFARVMAQLGDVECFTGSEAVRLSLAPSPRRISRIRVHFVTPTELKGADGPEFAILLARIRDRVSTLRLLYGAGPLELDFKAFGDRARHVQMTRCDLGRVASERVSRNTDQRHSLGGFVGVAEYEGELAEFVPYLQAACWSGVGRQTVWGKGEITVEEF